MENYKIVAISIIIYLDLGGLLLELIDPLATIEIDGYFIDLPTGPLLFRLLSTFM